jgi:hypothetical protein
MIFRSRSGARVSGLLSQAGENVHPVLRSRMYENLSAELVSKCSCRIGRRCKGEFSVLPASVVESKVCPNNSGVIPGKLAVASATRNPVISKILDAGFHRHDGKSRITS